MTTGEGQFFLNRRNKKTGRRFTRRPVFLFHLVYSRLAQPHRRQSHNNRSLPGALISSHTAFSKGMFHIGPFQGEAPIEKLQPPDRLALRIFLEKRQAGAHCLRNLGG